MNSEARRPHVLFVCLGNICRSPTAEAVFLKALQGRDLKLGWVVDSAGTSSVHAGHPADQRMQETCLQRGYKLTSLSRGFDPQNDFDEFDWIIGMDESNVANLKQFARSTEDADKIHLFTSFGPEIKASGVPDPYYGGEKGFYEVIELIENRTPHLLDAVQKCI